MGELVKYIAGGQEITLTEQTVVNYLVAGNGNVSKQEVKMFMELCHYRGLNPFIREAYLIKYGNSPATMVVGKDAILKKALSNPTYGSHEAGITLVNREGQIERRAGSMLLAREELVGGWCKVTKATASGIGEIMHEVSFDEYALRDSNGKLMSNWKNKPATMIRKVALVQALREAFPEDVSGMFEAEELGIDERTLPSAPVDPSKVVGEVESVPDTKEVVDEQEPVPATPKSPFLDMLDLSDSDFLSAPFKSGGKTKMIGQIKYDKWKEIADSGVADDVRQVALRAWELTKPVNEDEDDTPLPFSMD